MKDTNTHVVFIYSHKRSMTTLCRVHDRSMKTLILGGSTQSRWDPSTPSWLHSGRKGIGTRGNTVIFQQPQVCMTPKSSWRLGLHKLPPPAHYVLVYKHKQISTKPVTLKLSKISPPFKNVASACFQPLPNTTACGFH